MWEIIADILLKAFFGALASVGFAVLFNVPRRILLWCGICGALGLGLRTLGLTLGASLELSTLLGATAVGFFSFVPHHRLVLPTHVVSIPGTINMVPGVYAFKAMTGFMTFANTKDSAEFFAASYNFLTTLYVLMAIAMGLVLPSLFLRINKRTL